MTAARYAIGAHSYDQGSYTTGEWAAYLAALGQATGDGAIVHLKFRDLGELWRTGAIPTLAAQAQLSLSEAKAAGFRTLVAYVPENAWNAVDDSGAMANLDAAVAAMLAAGWAANADIFLMGNEREQKDVDNEEDWFTLENRCGQLWQAAGKGWAVGADQACANFLDTLRTRQATWDSTPDFLALHAYGDGGFVARQVRDLRLSIEHITGRTWRDKLVFTEWALAFEGLGAENTKPYVRDYRARDFNEHIGRALRRERVYGCYFTLRELMADPAEYPGFMPRQGIIDSLSASAVNAQPPSFAPLTAGLTTRRYLVEGRYATNEVGADLIGRAERQRSLLSYPSYWGS